MKKIINGRLYDTSTATQVGNWCNGMLPGDFAYYNEELYKKKTGEFFLHGKGGPMTPYGNGGSFGEEILPLTRKKAKEWLGSGTLFQGQKECRVTINSNRTLLRNEVKMYENRDRYHEQSH